MRIIVGVVLALVVACSAEAVAVGPNGTTSSDQGKPLADAGSESDADAVVTPDGATVEACPNGTLLADRTTCDATAATATASLASGLAQAAPGDTVSLDGFDSPSAPCLPVYVCAPADSATLFFSDSPESPSADGILYADTLAAGAYRLYVYHANGGTTARKFPIVVLNSGTDDATVTITRRGLESPTTSYVAMGKAVLGDWLADVAPTTVTVPAGQRVLLDPDLDAMHAAPQELVHAIYDVTTDASLKFSVVSVGVDADAAAVTKDLSLLPREATHQRGTFPYADVTLVPTAGLAANGVRRLRLGSADVDAPRTGKDERPATRRRSSATSASRIA